VVTTIKRRNGKEIFQNAIAYSGSVASPLKKKKRILLIDNDPRSAYMISLILKLNGYEVEFYADPKAMLLQLHNKAYDLILVSLSSTKTNYLELYNQIRNKDAQVKICFMIFVMPTIIMTTSLYNHSRKTLSHAILSTSQLIQMRYWKL
jgi:PleD family two-component response regulator